MAVISIKNKGKYGEMLAGNTAYDPARFYSIATATASGGETTLSFSNIPQTYQHLQIRGLYRDTNTSTAGQYAPSVRFNSDNTSSNYAWGFLRGGGSLYSYQSTSGFYTGEGTGSAISNTLSYGGNIIDIHDYTSSSKYKTIITLAGSDVNSTASTEYGNIYIMSMLWENTNPITSIDIVDIYTAFAEGTTFALYGIKGA